MNGSQTSSTHMSGSSDTNGDFGDDFVWILQASLNVGEKIQKELNDVVDRIILIHVLNTTVEVQQ